MAIGDPNAPTGQSSSISGGDILPRTSSWLGGALDQFAGYADNLLTSVAVNLSNVSKSLESFGHIAKGFEVLTGAKVGSASLYDTSGDIAERSRSVEADKQRRITEYQGARAGQASPTSGGSQTSKRKKKRKSSGGLEGSI